MLEKGDWEFSQSFSQTNLCDRTKELSGEYVPELVSVVVRKHDAGVVPDPRSDWWDIDVIEQASHETWHYDQDAGLFTLSDECDYVICFGALCFQRQVFTLLKNICLLFTQAQCFPYQEQLQPTVLGSLQQGLY